MIWDAIWTKIKCYMIRRTYIPVATFDEDEMDYFNDIEEDRMGMTVTSGTVKIPKNENNLIGVCIGGGAPHCICLYIVQVFDDTPVCRDGTLQSGDELTAVNGESVKGKTKVEVAKMIQSSKTDVIIGYNKLHADPKQGKTLDIVLKKVKHRIVENMKSTTADTFGLSRAILCNDTLVSKLKELEQNEVVYKGLVEHVKKMLKAFFELIQVYKAFGDIFAGVGVREPQPRASEAFTQFGEAHRTMEKYGIKFLKAVKPMLSDLGTYLNKAIPDTKLTIKKYADVKFEYLSYCLKVREMDEEEYTCYALHETLYRVESGNYEYRLILRCRQDARERFSKLRSDVLVKLELLDQKHVQDIVFQMNRLLAALSNYHNHCYELMQSVKVFPIELDLPQSTFQYPEIGSSVSCKPYRDEKEEEEEEDEEEDEDDDEIDVAAEAKEILSPKDSAKMKSSPLGLNEDLLSLCLDEEGASKPIDLLS